LRIVVVTAIGRQAHFRPAHRDWRNRGASVQTRTTIDGL